MRVGEERNRKSNGSRWLQVRESTRRRVCSETNTDYENFLDFSLSSVGTAGPSRLQALRRSAPAHWACELYQNSSREVQDLLRFSIVGAEMEQRRSALVFSFPSGKTRFCTTKRRSGTAVLQGTGLVEGERPREPRVNPPFA